MAASASRSRPPAAVSLIARFRLARASGALAARVAASACARATNVPPRRLRREADAEQLAGVDRLGGQKQLLRRRDAEPAHIAMDAARIINDAEPCHRHQQLHPFDADAKIAGESEIGYPSVNAAVQRRYGRDAQCLQPINGALEGV